MEARTWIPGGGIQDMPTSPGTWGPMRGFRNENPFGFLGEDSAHDPKSSEVLQETSSKTHRDLRASPKRKLGMAEDFLGFPLLLWFSIIPFFQADILRSCAIRIREAQDQGMMNFQLNFPKASSGECFESHILREESWTPRQWIWDL